jgi:hypothetical protein
MRQWSGTLRLFAYLLYFQAHGFPLPEGLTIGAEELPFEVMQFGGQKLLQAKRPIVHKSDNNIFIDPPPFPFQLAKYRAAQLLIYTSNSSFAN